jgi:hypothetical protein
VVVALELLPIMIKKYKKRDYYHAVSFVFVEEKCVYQERVSSTRIDNVFLERLSPRSASYP